MLTQELIQFIENWSFFYNDGEYSPLYIPNCCTEEELQKELGTDYYICSEEPELYRMELSRQSLWQ